MHRQLDAFLRKTAPGEQTVSELFLCFATRCCVPPTPANEREFERLLVARGLARHGVASRRSSRKAAHVDAPVRWEADE